MELFEWVLNHEEGLDGVFAISLVEKPAIQKNFIALSEHEVKLQVVDDEKRIVMGVALTPNKKILRVDGEGNPFNVFFSEETVREVSQVYMQQLRATNATLDHQVKAPGVYTVETWLCEDPEMDKSRLHNLGAEKGDWCIAMKVDNDAIWEDVKNGFYLGFSIEGLFDIIKPDPYKEAFIEIGKILKG